MKVEPLSNFIHGRIFAHSRNRVKFSGEYLTRRGKTQNSVLWIQGICRYACVGDFSSELSRNCISSNSGSSVRIVSKQGNSVSYGWAHLNFGLVHALWELEEGRWGARDYLPFKSPPLSFISDASCLLPLHLRLTCTPTEMWDFHVCPTFLHFLVPEQSTTIRSYEAAPEEGVNSVL